MSDASGGLWAQTGFAALRPLRGRWTFDVIAALLAGPLGYNELQRSLVGISPDTLSRRLEHLTDAQLVHREVVDTKPPTSRYALTARGAGLRPTLEAMSEWAATLDGGGVDSVDADWDKSFSLFEEKWTLQIHCSLADGPRQFSELSRELGVNAVTLRQRLVALELRGLIRRDAESRIATYEFTEAGHGFNRIGEELLKWVNAAAIQ